MFIWDIWVKSNDLKSLSLWCAKGDHKSSTMQSGLVAPLMNNWTKRSRITYPDPDNLTLRENICFKKKPLFHHCRKENQQRPMKNYVYSNLTLVWTREL